MKHIDLNTEMIHKGALILVNPAYAITEEPTNTLIPACDAVPDILLDRSAAVLLNQLMREIHGWRSIVPVSGYRPLWEQQNIWDDSLRDSGLEFTRKYVAVPGHSEHQTGLAIDLGLKQEHIDFICPEFPYTESARPSGKRQQTMGLSCATPPERRQSRASAMNRGISAM